MIKLSDISTPESFAHNVSSSFEQMNDKLYYLNTLFAHFIRSKEFPALRAFTSDNSPELCTVSSIKNILSSFTSAQVSQAQQYVDSLNAEMPPHIYVYVGSKIAFKNDFFPNYLPSAYSFVFNYLFSHNLIRPIGPGQSSVVLVSSSIFSADDFVLNNLFPYQTNNYTDNFNILLNQFDSLKADNDFLFTILEQKENLISELNTTIQQLEHKNYVTSAMTWR